VLAWGYNGDGQLGDGSKFDRHTPDFVQDLDGRVINLFLSSVRSAELLQSMHMCICAHTDSMMRVCQGGDHNLALLEDGRLQAWGLASSGQLGIGGQTARTYPFTITG
jgi:alpha-tubulin suppressor-like RCC1 family protein